MVARKWKVRAVGYSILLVLLLILSYYADVSYNAQAVYTAPTSPNYVIPFSLNWPDTPSFILGETGVAVAFNLVSNGTIAEGTPVQVYAPNGAITSPNYMGITDVNVIFPETVPADWNITKEGTFVGGVGTGVLFIHNNFTQSHYIAIGNLNNSLEAYPSPFKWLVSGDYSPTVEIDFANGGQIVYTYSQIKIHVESVAEAQTQNLTIESQKLSIQDAYLNRVNIILTVALVGVAVVETVRIIEDFAKGGEEHSLQLHSPNPYYQSIDEESTTDSHQDADD